MENEHGNKIFLFWIFLFCFPTNFPDELTKFPEGEGCGGGGVSHTAQQNMIMHKLYQSTISIVIVNLQNLIWCYESLLM
jgi:hypothetical protein